MAKHIEEAVPTQAPARVKALDKKEVVALLNSVVDQSLGLCSKMEPVPPQLGAVMQFLFSKKNGEYVVEEVGTLVKPIVTKPARPGKVAPQFQTWPAQDLIRNAFGGPGESAFDACPDGLIAKAAAKAATQAHLSGNDARTLARAVVALLAVRAGMAPPTVFEVV